MINIPAMGTPNSGLPQMEQNRITQLKAQAESGRDRTDEELMSVSHQFESIFIHQLLKSMRSTIQKSGLFDSHATRMYESMHDQEMANLMSEKRSIGLAEIVYKELVRLEEKMNTDKSDASKAITDKNSMAGIFG